MNPIALAIFAMFCALPASAQERKSATFTESPKEASRLLSDIKRQAADLWRDSSDLESLMHSPGVSWQSHFEQLADMRL